MSFASDSSSKRDCSALRRPQPLAGPSLAAWMALVSTLGRLELGLAAGLLDLLLGALAERVRAHGQRRVRLAVAEDLDGVERCRWSRDRPRQRASRSTTRAGVEALERPMLTIAHVAENGFLKPRFGKRR